jgi:hypothetical protein
VHQKDVARDREQSRSERLVGVVGVPEPVNLQKGFLEQVVGDRRVTRQHHEIPAQRRCDSRIESFETIEPSRLVTRHPHAELRIVCDRRGRRLAGIDAN